MRIRPDFIRQFPGLEERANRYVPAVRGLVSAAIAVITAIALLEIWGIDAAAWFHGSRLGGRLFAALSTIAIAVAVAMVVWERAMRPSNGTWQG